MLLNHGFITTQEGQLPRLCVMHISYRKFVHTKSGNGCARFKDGYLDRFHTGLLAASSSAENELGRDKPSYTMNHILSIATPNLHNSRGTILANYAFSVRIVSYGP